MTKKEQPFNWRHKQQEAFEKLKDEFTLACILASFYPEKKIMLEIKIILKPTKHRKTITPGCLLIKKVLWPKT